MPLIDALNPKPYYPDVSHGGVKLLHDVEKSSTLY